MLNYTFTKSDMGRKLICLVEHVAYPSGSENSSVALDVLCKYSFGPKSQSVFLHQTRTL